MFVCSVGRLRLSEWDSVHFENEASLRIPEKSRSVVIVTETDVTAASFLPAVKTFCGTRAALFLILFDAVAANDPNTRHRAMEQGYHMVAGRHDSLAAIMTILAKCIPGGGRLTCPLCPVTDFTPAAVHLHARTYHNGLRRQTGPCPFASCGGARHKLVLQHIAEGHCPETGDVAHHPPRDSGQLYCFALVVCLRPAHGAAPTAADVARLSGTAGPLRGDDEMLLVHEYALCGFWLPGGGVDRREDLASGAVRECLEEAGVAVELLGALAVNYTPAAHPDGAWCRLSVTFLATAVEGRAEAKEVPDYESLGAQWVPLATLAEQRLPLRSREPHVFAKQLLEGRHSLAPMGVFG